MIECLKNKDLWECKSCWGEFIVSVEAPPNFCPYCRNRNLAKKHFASQTRTNAIAGEGNYRGLR